MFLTTEQRAVYLWQYGLLIGIIFLCGIIALKYKKTSCWCVGLILFFIAAFKSPYLTHDTEAYIETFQNIYYGFYSTYMEKGYVLYNRILTSFFSNAQAIIIANSFFTMLGFLLLFLRYSKNAYLAICLFAFFSVDGYVRILNLSREYLAIAILMLGVPFIIKRWLLPFVLIVLLAGSFHTVAYIGLVFYFLYSIELNKKFIIAGIIASVLLGITPLLDMIVPLLLHTPFARLLYLYESGLKLAAFANALLSGGIFFICYRSYQKFKDNLNWNISPRFLLNSSFIPFCIYVISINNHAFDRLAYIFCGLNMLALSNFISAYPAKPRLAIALGVCALFITYSAISFVYRPEWGMPIPYSFCF